MPILQKMVSSTIHEVTQIPSSPQSSAEELFVAFAFLNVQEIRVIRQSLMSRGLRAWSGMQPVHQGSRTLTKSALTAGFQRSENEV